MRLGGCGGPSMANRVAQIEVVGWVGVVGLDDRLHECSTPASCSDCTDILGRMGGLYRCQQLRVGSIT